MSAKPDAAWGEYQLLTGPGPAAIAVVRVCGPLTATFVARHVGTRRPATEKFWQIGQVLRAELLDEDGAPLDDILLSVHATPPVWDLRLHLHANPWLVRHCAELLGACGFAATSDDRTTLWPTTDTLEAEAYALLPRMLTLRGARWLLGQVGLLRTAIVGLLDADVRSFGANEPGAQATGPQPLAGARGSLAGREFTADVARTCAAIAARAEIVDWFARPLRIVLAGPPNVGKSTLANALADRPVSLVSATPGTTRDWVEVPAEAGGFPVVWIDTAGVRAGAAGLEAAGVELTRRLIREADAVLVVLDIADPARDSLARFLETYGGPEPAGVALNKSDLGGSAELLRAALPARWQARSVVISATRQTGLDALTEAVLGSVGRTAEALDQPAAFTPRQARLLKEAAAERESGALRRRLLQFIGSAEVT